MPLTLCYYGHPILREKANPVTEFDDSLAKLANEMVASMRAESGIGLAGPQIGKSMRIFVMEIPPEMDADEAGRRLNPHVKFPLVAINPEINPQGDEEDGLEEGCLSIPDVRGRVERPVTVQMNYQTVTGDKKSIPMSGLAARCAQHELDHLNGILFIDHLGSVKRMAIKNKLKKLKSQFEKSK